MKLLNSLLIILFFALNLNAQIYPISLESRVQNSSIIVKAKLKSKHSYWDQYHANIYTLNVMEISAFLKGNKNQKELAIITEGGIIGNQAQKSYPETNIIPNTEYVLFLESENFEVDHKIYRTQFPNTIQCKAVARIQGALPFQNNKYYDAFSDPQTEADLFEKIQRIVGQEILQPDGSPYVAIEKESENGNNDRLVVDITSIEDGAAGSGPFYAGTIDTDKELIIKGTGFGGTRGSSKVEFDWADDGGMSLIQPPVTSDYVSWSDIEIRVKVPAYGGTGDVKVTAGGSSDTEPITIDWAIIPVNNTFYNWSSSSRNRVELVDTNDVGGYTFEYSTVGGFSGNADAEAAFERALSTWRCDSEVHFDVDDSGTGTGFAIDGVCIVMFAGGLGGALGVASSRYFAIATGSCDMEDTFWHLSEVDLRFDSGTSWYYGSGSCGGSQYDFESVALHEIGHGHGLGHVIDDTKVMHYSIGTCDDSGNIRRTLSSAESAAGVHKMAHSVLSNCITSPSPMIAVPEEACSLMPLPIELISFDGKLIDEAVELNWQSATEINNEYFTLERSLDGRNYETIAIVKGQGTSFETHSYQYFDNNPSLGVNYYRLTQTDFDGTFEVFDQIVAVKFVGDINAEIRPNPVHQDDFQLIYNSNHDGDLDVEIYSVTGQLLYKEVYKTNKALNHFDISLSGLSNGIYIVKTNQNNFVENIRFVKAN